jgi:hypothetical protein
MSFFTPLSREDLELNEVGFFSRVKEGERTTRNNQKNSTVFFTALFQFSLAMEVCNLTTDSFNGKVAGDAYLDDNFRCRTCQRTAGAHSAPAVQPGN